GTGSDDWWSNGKHEVPPRGTRAGGRPQPRPIPRRCPGRRRRGATRARRGARGRGAGVPPAEPAAGRADRRRPGAAAPGGPARRAEDRRGAGEVRQGPLTVASTVFFHVGLPKTGTPYLQTLLWNNEDELRRQGVLLPGESVREHLWASGVVREDPKIDRRGPLAAGAWDRIVADVNDWPGTAIVSHEFFAAASAEQAARAMERLQGA